MANPNSSGTAYTMLATMVQLMGEDKGFEYLKALHTNINQYTKSGSAPIKAAGLGETTIGIVFMHDAVSQAAAGFPIVPVAPCEGTGYEIGSMSLIKGARNAGRRRRSSTTGRSPPRCSRGRKDVNSFQLPSNKNATPSPTVARPLDDQADRLRLQEVRLERGAQAPAAEVGRRRSRRCRNRPMRARKTVAHPAPDRRPLDGGRAGRLLPAALVRARRATSSPSRWLFDGWPLDDDVAPALFLVLQGQKLWLAPLGLLLLAAAARSGAARSPTRCSAVC